MPKALPAPPRLESTDPVEGIAPVLEGVRPGPRWPGIHHRSPRTGSGTRAPRTHEYAGAGRLPGSWPPPVSCCRTRCSGARRPGTRRPRHDRRRTPRSSLRGRHPRVARVKPHPRSLAIAPLLRSARDRVCSRAEPLRGDRLVASSVSPGRLLVVEGASPEAAVQVADEPIGERPERLMVGLSGCTSLRVEVAAAGARLQRAQRPLVGSVVESPVADKARLHGPLAPGCYG